MGVTNADVDRVAVSDASAATLVLANRNRRGFHVYNDSGGTLYVKLGLDASSTDFTEKLSAGDRLTLRGIPIYVGVITARMATGSGDVQVTETYG